MPSANPPTPDAFITRWSSAGASERANAQLFLAELADLLGVPRFSIMDWLKFAFANLPLAA